MKRFFNDAVRSDVSTNVYILIYFYNLQTVRLYKNIDVKGTNLYVTKSMSQYFV